MTRDFTKALGDRLEQLAREQDRPLKLPGFGAGAGREYVIVARMEMEGLERVGYCKVYATRLEIAKRYARRRAERAGYLVLELRDAVTEADPRAIIHPSQLRADMALAQRRAATDDPRGERDR